MRLMNFCTILPFKGNKQQQKPALGSHVMHWEGIYPEDWAAINTLHGHISETRTLLAVFAFSLTLLLL